MFYKLQQIFGEKRSVELLKHQSVGNQWRPLLDSWTLIQLVQENPEGIAAQTVHPCKLYDIFDSFDSCVLFVCLCCLLFVSSWPILTAFLAFLSDQFPVLRDSYSSSVEVKTFGQMMLWQWGPVAWARVVLIVTYPFGWVPIDLRQYVLKCVLHNHVSQVGSPGSPSCSLEDEHKKLKLIIGSFPMKSQACWSFRSLFIPLLALRWCVWIARVQSMNF